MKIRLALFLALAALFAGNVAVARKTAGESKSTHDEKKKHKGPKASGERGTFDYYVMSLSWSPTYCEAHPGETEQCEKKGFGFVLHGLWPQYESGGGPEHCPTTDEPDKKTVQRALAFMPSRTLVDHEWRAHGACSGFDPPGYFDLADRAFATVKAPSALTAPTHDVTLTSDSLRDALKKANPRLIDDAISLHCSRGELAEVRVCLAKDDLSPRACGKGMKSRCPATAEFAAPASK
jgi:ribonuclease T2